MKELSKMLAGIPPSATLAISDKAAALRRDGVDVIALAGGDPDFDTPPHIVRAVVDAIESGRTHYPSPTRGLTGTMEAIAAKMARDSNLQVDPATDI
ncbi:MAG: aspartate aminotransferase, partial [Candidatus Promineifilaceae bacterium]|nr:aspartate aminotransferase [Candidatus Promineifilaceae bacterium]